SPPIGQALHGAASYDARLTASEGKPSQGALACDHRSAHQAMCSRAPRVAGRGSAISGRGLASVVVLPTRGRADSRLADRRDHPAPS
ncbi:MAG: hypothetical protein OXR73_18030, partial [Myxococcales bacterium]|nr:hypothetical protein [Myxococcales bacterium]